MAATLTEVGVRHFTEDAETYRTHCDGEWSAEPITGMADIRRLNAALLLLATAEAQARRFEAFALWDRREVPFIADPVAWLEMTGLFRALVAGLPRKRTPLVILDERARHESGCPAGVNGNGLCCCRPRPASDRAVLAVVMAAANRGAGA